MIKIYQIIKKVLLYCIIIKLSWHYKNQYALNFYYSNYIPKISIFLPIYNKGNYLKNGIESLKSQTLKDIEIVAVNDGSTDNSLKILKKLAKSDKRIKIINNDRNHGPLYSRAMGVTNSTGEYMMNLDADDKIVNDNSLKLIYNRIKSMNDGYLRYLINRIPVNKNETFSFDILNKNQLEFEDFLISNKLVARNVYLKAYSFLEERIFGNKWIVHDDNVWNLLIRKYSNNSIIFNQYIYYYKRNEESLNTLRGSLIDLRSLVYRLDMILNIYGTLENKKFTSALNKIINFYNNTSELPEKEITNHIYKIYLKYSSLNNLEYYFRKDLNFHLEKIYNGKIIIFYDSKEEQFITYLIQIILLLLHKKLMKKKILFVDSKYINDIRNNIYYNDILIGINNIFFTSELNCIINSHSNNRLIVFSNALNKELTKGYNIKKNHLYLKFLNHAPFENINDSISEPIFHFIPSSLIYVSIISQYIRKNKINKILFLFTNKYDIDDLKKHFKIIKLEYSADFKYIHYPINIINLINIIIKYKFIITNNDVFAKLSSILLISCSLFEKNFIQSQMSKLIYNPNYIRPLKDINNFLNDIGKIQSIEYKNKIY